MSSPFKILWVRSEVCPEPENVGLIDNGEFDDSTQGFYKKSEPGFKFSPNNQKAFKKPLQKIFSYLGGQGLWEPLINNGMATGFSWGNSSHQYFSLYQKIFKFVKNH